MRALFFLLLATPALAGSPGDEPINTGHPLFVQPPEAVAPNIPLPIAQLPPRQRAKALECLAINPAFDVAWMNDGRFDAFSCKLDGEEEIKVDLTIDPPVSPPVVVEPPAEPPPPPPVPVEPPPMMGPND